MGTAMREKHSTRKTDKGFSLLLSIVLVFCVLGVVVFSVSRKITAEMSDSAIQNLTESLNLIQSTIEAILNKEAEFQLDVQHLGGNSGALYHIPAGLHDVAVGLIVAHGLLRFGGVGEVVGQAQDAVIALAQHGGVQVNALLLVPEFRGDQPVQRDMDVCQGDTQMTGDLLEYLAELFVLMKKI